MRGARLRLTAGAHAGRGGEGDGGDDDEALAGVCGGLGYLGAIAEVELPLAPMPHAQIETEVVAAGGAAEVLAACAPDRLPTDGVTTGYGVLHADLRRGLAYRARPVSGRAPRPYLAVHQPRSALRLLGELLLLTHAGAPLVSELAYRLHRERYVDDLLDYTFFMEGDARLRLAGRRLGLGLRIVQQSFAVPVDAAGELIERARRGFAAHALVPMLSDVLYCPADRALLSATYRRGGFIVSFAFSPRTRARHARIGVALRELSAVCRQLGGRVRLGKHVHAAPDELAAMYEDALPRFARLKRRLDPDGLLRNEFLERVFPGLVAAPPAGVAGVAGGAGGA
jgi:decaprenylphospho-beta-D-ribofuranose 2-oxidase